MGILSSLAHPANGDTAGESTRGEAEEETAAGERQAGKESWLLSACQPSQEPSGGHTRTVRSHEDDHEAVKTERELIVLERASPSWRQPSLRQEAGNPAPVRASTVGAASGSGG